MKKISNYRKWMIFISWLWTISNANLRMKGDKLKFFTANVAQRESLENCSIYLDYKASALWNEKFYLHFLWIIIKSILTERNISTQT